MNGKTARASWSNRRFVYLILFFATVFSFVSVGVLARQEDAKALSQVHIWRRPADSSDFERAAGVRFLRFDYDAKKIEIPKNKKLILQLSAELHVLDAVPRFLKEPYQQMAGREGTFLLTYYQEPLWTNDGDRLFAKYSLDAGGAKTDELLTPKMPFQVRMSADGEADAFVKLGQEFPMVFLGEKYATTVPKVAPAFPGGDPNKVPPEEKHLAKMIVFKAVFLLRDSP